VANFNIVCLVHSGDH